MRLKELFSLLLFCDSAFGLSNNNKPNDNLPVESADNNGSCQADSCQPDVNPKVTEECGLYLAASSIPNAGLGIFSAKEIQPGERLSYGDLVCNVEDFDSNRMLQSRFLLATEQQPGWLLYSYVWSPRVALAAFEGASITSIIPGVGTMANGHPALFNALPETPIRVADWNRARDPGAGASTHFHEAHFFAIKPIPAGAEIFLDYGESWFEERQKDGGDVPLSRHWKHADALLRMYNEMLKGDFQSDMAREAYEMLQFAVQLDPRLKNALPRHFQDVPKALQEGAARTLLPESVRTQEWLQENGMCLDHIRPGMSTLRQAGRGAFATRTLAKGSVIAPLPVVQLRRHHMEVYETRKVKKSGEEQVEEVVRIGSQLLLNYCFGHRESSLLLFPYSPVVNYLNHNQTLKNAELRWSNHTNHRKDWLDRSPADLGIEAYAGMIMEIVATRDIEAGEEVFLDYGNEWEEAWQKHVLEWKPSEKLYVSAADRNAMNEPLLLDEEMRKDPSYENVLLACFVQLPRGDSAESNDSFKVMWRLGETTFEGRNLHECKVRKQRRDGNYDVRIETGGITWHVENIPRDAIQYFDAMYKSDMFIRSAFRHEIALPDDMVPDAWRDLSS